MRIYPALAFATFGLLSCATVAIADQIGFDVTTGQKRALNKTDKTLVGTKQSIDAGQVIQRNSLGITILPPGAELAPGQFSSPKECIGKIAKISLSCSTCIDQASVKEARKPINFSIAVQAVSDLAAGEFVEPSKVKTIEKSVPPEQTPIEWLSNLRDVVGRKTIKAVRRGEILTESHFGPRGTILHPEEVKYFENNK